MKRIVPGFSVSLLTPTLHAEDVPLHTHENASFIVVLSGAYHSSADGAPPICTMPTLIYNPPGTTHRDSFLQPAGRFCAISVADGCLRAAEDVLPRTAKAFPGGEGLAVAGLLARHRILAATDNTAEVENLCWQLLSAVAKDGPRPQKPAGSPPAWIRRAQEILHDDSGADVSITGMARELDLHPVYFARAFRRFFRCTPAEYRMRCRLRRVMAALQNGRHPLTEIALAAGFCDQSHLTTAFRRHFGVSPHAYRDSFRGHHRKQREVQSIQDAAASRRETSIQENTAG